MTAKNAAYGRTYDPALYTALMEIARERLAGKELEKRRPPLGLRFQLDDLTRLVLKPRLNSSPSGWKIAQYIDVEMRTRLDTTVSKFPALEIKARLLEGNIIKPVRWWRDEDKTRQAFDKLEAALKQLASSPESIFEQSKYWCCICGRKLSDPVSQSRGIGPECVKTGDALLRLIREREAA